MTSMPAAVLTNGAEISTRRALLADGAIDLRLGDWRSALADIDAVDTLITDPPYSEVTDKGYRTNPGGLGDVKAKMSYAPITESDAVDLANAWCGRVKHWVVIFGDHISWAWHAKAWANVDWYVYQPVPWCRTGAAPRFDGRGPSSAVDWMLVARARTLPQGWGCTPGHYNAGTPRGAEKRALLSGAAFVGAKDLQGMRKVVRDYSRPGERIVDCFAGTGTTLEAAVVEGRGGIAAEIEPAHFDIARRRLERGHTPDMFATTEAK